MITEVWFPQIKIKFFFIVFQDHIAILGVLFTVYFYYYYYYYY